MVNGPFPQIKVERDQGGIARRVSSEDWLLPEEIRSEALFNWLGKPRESREEYLGIQKRVQFSQEGKPITEKIDYFGEIDITHNYDPEAGEYLGSFLEVDND